MREDLYPDYEEDIPTQQKHIARVPQQKKKEEPVQEQVSESNDDEDNNDEYDDSFDNWCRLY